jgi:hypothetical protein
MSRTADAGLGRFSRAASASRCHITWTGAMLTCNGPFLPGTSIWLLASLGATGVVGAAAAGAAGGEVAGTGGLDVSALVLRTPSQ